MALLRLEGPVRDLRSQACLLAAHAVRRPRSHTNNPRSRQLHLVSSQQHAAACQRAARDSLRRWASTYRQPVAMSTAPAGLDAYNDGPYGEAVETLRDREYPHMNQGVYLDHSGTTIYARSTVEAFANKMTTNLYGNPHSANEPAKVSGDMVDEIRDKALRFLGADPEHFDLVFVANATAAIKLVADAFRDLAERTWSGSFWYGYHKDSHTSLVGVRELAGGANMAGAGKDVHQRLYGSMDNVSRHTSRLAARLYRGVASLRHHNGAPVCHIYGDEEGACPAFGDADRQGATIAFNVVHPDGTYVPYSEVEEVANSKGIYIRSGGICCPGGLFTALDYEPWELERAMSAGHHCGPHGLSIVNQLPTGVVRASLGPMSTARDVDVLVQFLSETFAARQQQQETHEHHIDGGRDRPLEAVACFG
ncbi:molybdenum cofactor sulfurase [Magnaporthiopsis poae ATCC 64411]|uniref:Molybdenum cofactor sulfurase n=1 Tax=Magnaporthiopsis poae (strain ATCC 64411 / 73-15) TaxID=644358 RepID=A0A0C4DRW5_MAGP6|nr:molybdenum cofactor sulfurase [Magnaporthiopsis poae ATCC 64411]